jgi:hypothetical protein
MLLVGFSSAREHGKVPPGAGFRTEPNDGHGRPLGGGTLVFESQACDFGASYCSRAEGVGHSMD